MLQPLKTVFTLLTVVLATFSAYSFDFKQNGLYYNVLPAGDEVEITYDVNEKSSYAGTIHIPATVENEGKTYQVVSIGDNAFYNSKITTIHIPDNITNIGDHAFYFSTELQNVTLPHSLKRLGAYSLAGTAILSVAVPEGITTIESSTFLSCEALHTLFLPSTLTKINTYGFYACHQLKEIYIPAAAAPDAKSFAVFQGLDEIDIIVPESSILNYQAAEGWKNFSIYPPDPFTMVMTIHGTESGDYDEIQLDDFKAFRIYDGERLIALTSSATYLLPNTEAKTFTIIPTDYFSDAAPLYYSTKGGSVSTISGDTAKIIITDSSISVKGTATMPLEVIDLNGVVVARSENSPEIATETLLKGAYIVKCGAMTQKIIIK
ncbi:MAG: leucine-rich repeat domain-containing protein [Muribaculaceae bacterium]|nr:leucine-rich repeat domain-containing protein [Muribaculaceae bacterium]